MIYPTLIIFYVALNLNIYDVNHVFSALRNDQSFGQKNGTPYLL